MQIGNVDESEDEQTALRRPPHTERTFTYTRRGVTHLRSEEKKIQPLLGLSSVELDVHRT